MCITNCTLRLCRPITRSDHACKYCMPVSVCLICPHFYQQMPTSSQSLFKFLIWSTYIFRHSHGTSFLSLIISLFPYFSLSHCSTSTASTHPSISDHFLSLFSSFHFHSLPRSVLLSISVPPVSTSVNVTLPLFTPPVDEIYWKS